MKIKSTIKQREINRELKETKEIMLDSVAALLNRIYSLEEKAILRRQWLHVLQACDIIHSSYQSGCGIIGNVFL